jgi:hypothetical protein
MRQVVLFFVLSAVGPAVFAQSPTPTPATAPTVLATDLPASQAPTRGIKPGSVTGYTRPSAATRRKRFINGMVGPLALGRTVFNAGLSTWTNSPEEWGDNWEGFGRRVASNFGKNVIRQSVTYGLDEAFKLDSHFYRSKDKSVGARVRNAVISPITARDKNGKRVFGFPRLVGSYTANIVARETWYPDRYDWKDGVKSGTISLGFNAAFNLFKEFVWKK